MAAAAVLIAVAAAPAAADFRYVAPDRAADGGTRADDPGAAAGEPGATGIEAAPDDGPEDGLSAPPLWHVREGEMLRAALARWGARADVEVLFLTDRRYRLDGAASFEGSFADAVQRLFRGLGHLPHPPVAARAEGKALVVTHRARTRTERSQTERSRTEGVEP